MTATPWTLDKSHSSINFSVRHLMVSKVRGQFHDWSGTLLLDNEDPTKSSVEVIIQAASIDTREAKRDEHLRSADFFNVEEVSDAGVQEHEGGQRKGDDLAVVGDLTIHGVTKPIVLVVETTEIVKDPWGGTRTGFSAKASLSRKEFGLHWNAALETGGFVVGDKIDLDLEIEAIHAAQKAA